MEIFRTLTYYNERNNTPLLIDKIQEAIRKVMEEESISDAKNVTSDTFSNTSNTQRQNANTIFTSENLDKSDKRSDAVNNLTINDAGFYESNTAISSGAQGDPTRDSKTFTHTINRNEKVADTSNGDFEKKNVE